MSSLILSDNPFLVLTKTRDVALLVSSWPSRYNGLLSIYKLYFEFAGIFTSLANCNG